MWRKVISRSSGSTYYYNAATGTSKWSLDAGDVLEPSDVADSAGTTNRSAPIADDGRPTKRVFSEIEQPVHTETALSSSSSTGVPAPGGASTVIRRQDALEDCAAPVSGSAADKLPARILPAPRFIASYPFSQEDKWVRQDLQKAPFLAGIYRAGQVTDRRGKVHKYKDCVDPFEGRHLYDVIFENKFMRTLEVGLAMGASTTWICQAHNDLGLNGTHISIDPNQLGQYEGIGLHVVASAGVDRHLTHMPFTSYRALPMLLEDVIAKRREPFEMIFIDGWHTFDYTLVDFFYADLLLAVNGVIVIDDIKHTPVKKTLAFITSNYPNYELIPNTPCSGSMATLRKLDTDKREWNYHKDF
jgi:predicted O-methyltransferase YrrM